MKNTLNYIKFGLIISVLLIIINLTLRPYFFPNVKFENSVIFYLIFIVVVILLSIVFGYAHQLLTSKTKSKNVLYYLLFVGGIILYLILILVILFFINIFISFNRSF